MVLHVFSSYGFKYLRTTAYSDKSVVTVTQCEIILIMLNTGKLFSFNTGLLVLFLL